MSRSRTAIGLTLSLLAVCAVATTPPATDPVHPDTSALIPLGWRETVISVTDLEEWTRFYQQTLGWELRGEGTVPRALLSAWQLPEGATAQFALVANPGSESGFVRIVDFDGVEQRRVRHHSQSWETGGIYNMNIRVLDMAEIEPKVTDAGWQAPSAPVRFTFGPFVVWEWIPRHKDGVRMAFVERVEPPLEGWPNLKVSSRVFNSTQIVGDMDKAVAFYQGLLGFKSYLEHQGASQKPMEHVLGMSREAMTSVVRDVRILNPTGTNEGSVELLAFEGYSGRDFSAHAVPPNLGNLMLRYPVPSVDRLAAYLRKAGAALEYEPIETSLEPYGAVKLFAVRAPDGAWIEFFEHLAARGQAPTPSQATAEPGLGTDLATIMEWWDGDYDNQRQIDHLEAVGRPVWRADGSGKGGHIEVVSHYRPYELPAFGDHVIYVEETKHGDPEALFRQRIYTLKIDPEIGAIRVKLWYFNDKEKYVGAWQDLSRLDSLSPEDMFALPDGCDLMVKRQDGKFHMPMPAKDCVFGERYFNYQVLLGPDSFWFRDRIVRVEDDVVLETAGNFSYHELDKVE